MTDRDDQDRQAIDDLIRVFFDAFTSGDGLPERMAAMRRALLPQAVIVRTGGGDPAVYDVDSFITPRQELLTDGRLTDFREWPMIGRTDIFGDMAAHFCGYAKSGVRDGALFTARGMKSFQFARTAEGWRIAAVTWADEHGDLTVGPDWSA